MKKFLVLFATIFVALLFSTQTIFAVNNISKIDIEQLGDTYLAYTGYRKYWRVTSNHTDYIKGNAYLDENKQVPAKKVTFTVELDGLFPDHDIYPVNKTVITTDENGHFNSIINVGQGAGLQEYSVYRIVHRSDLINIAFKNNDGTLIEARNSTVDYNVVKKVYRLAYRYRN